jgi:hypothetical protein
VVQMNVSYLSPITEVTWSWCFTWPFRDAFCFPHVQTVPEHALMYDQSLINVYQSFRVHAPMHYQHLPSHYVRSVLVQALMHYRPLSSTYLRPVRDHELLYDFSLTKHYKHSVPDQPLVYLSFLVQAFMCVQSLIKHYRNARSVPFQRLLFDQSLIQHLYVSHGSLFSQLQFMELSSLSTDF